MKNKTKQTTLTCKHKDVWKVTLRCRSSSHAWLACVYLSSLRTLHVLPGDVTLSFAWWWHARPYLGRCANKITADHYLCPPPSLPLLYQAMALAKLIFSVSQIALQIVTCRRPGQHAMLLMCSAGDNYIEQGQALGLRSPRAWDGIGW